MHDVLAASVDRSVHIVGSWSRHWRRRAHGEETTVNERVKKFFTSDAWDVVIRFVVIVSMVGMLYAIAKIQSTSDCLQNYIKNNSNVASDDRKVVDNLVAEITQAKSAADTRAALAEYMLRRQHNDQLRASNPPC
jgi:hypothetical protein